MVLDNDVFSWRRAGGWAVLAWLAFGLAALIEPRLPGNTPWLLAAAPLLVVFLAGIHERGAWWIYGSLVTLVPMVILVGWTLASLVIGASPGSEMATGILLVAGPLLIGCSAVALVVTSSLGVWIGRRIEARRLLAP
jgi:hypothetical protein